MPDESPEPSILVAILEPKKILGIVFVLTVLVVVNIESWFFDIAPSITYSNFDIVSRAIESAFTVLFGAFFGLVVYWIFRTLVVFVAGYLFAAAGGVWKLLRILQPEPVLQISNDEKVKSRLGWGGTIWTVFLAALLWLLIFRVLGELFVFDVNGVFAILTGFAVFFAYLLHNLSPKYLDAHRTRLSNLLSHLFANRKHWITCWIIEMLFGLGSSLKASQFRKPKGESPRNRRIRIFRATEQIFAFILIVTFVPLVTWGSLLIYAQDADTKLICDSDEPFDCECNQSKGNEWTAIASTREICHVPIQEWLAANAPELQTNFVKIQNKAIAILRVEPDKMSIGSAIWLSWQRISWRTIPLNSNTPNKPALGNRIGNNEVNPFKYIAIRMARLRKLVIPLKPVNSGYITFKQVAGMEDTSLIKLKRSSTKHSANQTDLVVYVADYGKWALFRTAVDPSTDHGHVDGLKNSSSDLIVVNHFVRRDNILEFSKIRFVAEEPIGATCDNCETSPETSYVSNLVILQKTLPTIVGGDTYTGSPNFSQFDLILQSASDKLAGIVEQQSLGSVQLQLGQAELAKQFEDLATNIELLAENIELLVGQIDNEKLAELQRNANELNQITQEYNSEAGAATAAVLALRKEIQLLENKIGSIEIGAGTNGPDNGKVSGHQSFEIMPVRPVGVSDKLKSEDEKAFSGCYESEPDYYIEFARGSTRPKKNADYDNVQSVVAELAKSKTPARIFLKGTADSIGDAAANLTISEKRASVVQYEIEKQLRLSGIIYSTVEIISVGLGEALRKRGKNGVVPATSVDVIICY